MSTFLNITLRRLEGILHYLCKYSLEGICSDFPTKAKMNKHLQKTCHFFS